MKSYLRTKKATYKLHSLIQKGVEPLPVSDGNNKLVPSDDTGFLIWNIPAVLTCPGRTKHCELECYARKAELNKHWANVLPARLRNWELSKQSDFVDRMTYTILKKRAGSRKKWLVVRIHESGDFYNQKYADAWLEIIRNCSGERIRFICYTKSFWMFDGVALPSNLAFRASVWDDTSETALETIARNKWNVYTAVEQFRKDDGFYHCRCSDCATCKACWTKRKHIACEIH